MPKHIIALAAAFLAVAAGVGFSAPAEAKSCSNGVCGDSTDDGRTLNVYFTTTLLGVTHYNLRYGGKQIESSGRWSIAVSPGQRVDYSVQACARGGLLQKSKCTGWASFYHEVDPPRTPAPSPVTAGPKPCRPGFVWRLGAPNDYVCVRPSKRYQKPGGGAYGPATCKDGYVWRNSFDGDTQCVTPDERARTGRP